MEPSNSLSSLLLRSWSPNCCRQAHRLPQQEPHQCCSYCCIDQPTPGPFTGQKDGCPIFEGGAPNTLCSALGSTNKSALESANGVEVVSLPKSPSPGWAPTERLLYQDGEPPRGPATRSAACCQGRGRPTAVARHTDCRSKNHISAVPTAASTNQLLAHLLARKIGCPIFEGGSSKHILLRPRIDKQVSP